MKKRETTWDEEDTTSDAPLLPGELGSQVTAAGAMKDYIQRIYTEGVSKQIREMCEDRVEVNKVVDQIPPVRQEGDSLIIPVIIERMVLVKKTILVEEIVLHPQERDEDGDLEDC